MNSVQIGERGMVIMMPSKQIYLYSLVVSFGIQTQHTYTHLRARLWHIHTHTNMHIISEKIHHSLWPESWASPFQLNWCSRLTQFPQVSYSLTIRHKVKRPPSVMTSSLKSWTPSVSLSHLNLAAEKRHSEKQLQRFSRRKLVTSEMIEMSERSPLCQTFPIVTWV